MSLIGGGGGSGTLAFRKEGSRRAKEDVELKGGKIKEDEEKIWREESSIVHQPGVTCMEEGRGGRDRKE